MNVRVSAGRVAEEGASQLFGDQAQVVAQCIKDGRVFLFLQIEISFFENDSIPSMIGKEMNLHKGQYFPLLEWIVIKIYEISDDPVSRGFPKLGEIGRGATHTVCVLPAR
ncbi:MAG TPA: hypothetical protein VFY83_00185 [Anaerolineales bacterium]|nr:hypothetical protein [Anaerolineales bacterium]